VRAEFSLEACARYTPGKGWAPHGGVQFNCMQLEQKVGGCLTLADTGLPLLEMPEGLLRLVLNLLLPRAVEEALGHALPPELGEYLLRCGVSARVEGSICSNATPFTVLDANLCDDPTRGDANHNAAIAAARVLACVNDTACAKLLANMLCDWRALGLPAGPEPRRHVVLGIPAGDAGVERGRVSLGDLARYASRVAAWGREAECATQALWQRAMARRCAGTPPVCVAASMVAVRRLARKPVRASVTLHALSGGINAHAALRQVHACERRRGGRDELLLSQLGTLLDAAAANMHATSARLVCRLADGELEVDLEDVHHEGPLHLWGGLSSLKGGSFDLRRPHAAASHPPLPLLLRVAAEAAVEQQQPAAATVAGAESGGGDAAAAAAAEATADGLVLRLEAFCPEDMCAPLDAEEAAEGVAARAVAAATAAAVAAVAAAAAARGQDAAAAAACDGPVAEPPAMATEDDDESGGSGGGDGADASAAAVASSSPPPPPVSPPLPPSAGTFAPVSAAVQPSCGDEPAAPDALDAAGLPLTGVLAAEVSGLRCALVVDPAMLMAAAASAARRPDGSPNMLPALTVSLEAKRPDSSSSGGGGSGSILADMAGGGGGGGGDEMGLDFALRAAPGVRLQLAVRRAALTCRVTLWARVACRYLAGLAQRLDGSGGGTASTNAAAAAAAAAAHPLPGALPAAVLLRAAERHLRGVSVGACLTASARVNEAGELLLEASGVPGAGDPFRCDFEFKLADVADEAVEVAAAVSALHAARSQLVAELLPRWVRPPPAQLRTAPLETPLELAPAAAGDGAVGADGAPAGGAAAAANTTPAVAVPLADKPKTPPRQQSGFQLPFQNEIAGVLRVFPGNGGR
jgi:hypothetical protein